MINVRNKGSNYERLIAKLINNFLGTNLKRTPNSGALDFKGDIIETKDTCVHNVHFEIKNQAKLSIPKWWKQTTTDCSSNKIPVLIYKHNQEHLVTLRLYDLLYFIKDNK